MENFYINAYFIINKFSHAELLIKVINKKGRVDKKVWKQKNPSLENMKI